jgi:hypothetical protein
MKNCTETRILFRWLPVFQVFSFSLKAADVFTVELTREGYNPAKKPIKVNATSDKGKYFSNLIVAYQFQQGF